MTEKIEPADPAVFTAEHAGKVAADLKAILKSIEGKTGHATVLRAQLEGALARAQNVK